MFEHRHFSRRIQWCTIIFLFEYAYHFQTRPNPNDWVGQVTTKSAKNWVTITRQGHACILLYQILNDYIHLYSLSIYLYIYILFICTLYPLYIIYYPIWHISYSNQVSCVLHRSVIFAKIPKFWPIPRMSPDVQHLPQRMCVAIRILEHLMIISIDIGYILDKYWINIGWFGASPLFV